MGCGEGGLCACHGPLHPGGVRVALSVHVQMAQSLIVDTLRIAGILAVCA